MKVINIGPGPDGNTKATELRRIRVDAASVYVLIPKEWSLIEARERLSNTSIAVSAGEYPFLLETTFRNLKFADLTDATD